MFKFMGLLIVVVHSAPIDDPIRVDLPVYNQPQADTSSSAIPFLANPLEIENHPGDQPRNNDFDIGNFISNKVAATSNVLSNKIPSLPGHGLFSPPVTSRENAVLETEGFGSKAHSIKENAEKIAVDIFQPKPIVDTIKEEDKYGNSGDKFYSAGQALVQGGARLAQIANSILGAPGKIISSISRAATEKLNNFGGKLVGL